MCHNIHALRGEEIVRENIKLVRTRLGLTLGQFANLAGVGLSTVAVFECGNCSVYFAHDFLFPSAGVGTCCCP